MTPFPSKIEISNPKNQTTMAEESKQIDPTKEREAIETPSKSSGKQPAAESDDASGSDGEAPAAARRRRSRRP